MGYHYWGVCKQCNNDGYERRQGAPPPAGCEGLKPLYSRNPAVCWGCHMRSSR